MIKIGIICNPRSQQNKRDTSAAHGAPLGEDEVIATKQLMEWPTEPFFVPDELGAAA